MPNIRKSYARRKNVSLKYRKRRALSTVKRVRGRGSRSKVKSALPISECGMNYLKAQYNPFAQFTSLPCIPDANAVPSVKKAYRIRTTLTLTAGEGYILVNPYNMANKTGNAGSRDDYALALYKAVTTSGVMTKATDTADSFIKQPSEYINATLEDNNKVRTVGCGVKVQYQGQWDALQGHVTLYEHPTNRREYLQDEATISIADLRESASCAFAPIQHGMEYMVVYHPVDTADFEYEPHSNKYNQGDQNRWDCGVMLIHFEGCAAGATFTVEMVTMFECVGQDIHGTATSEVDLVAFAAIQKLPKAQLATAATSGTLNYLYNVFRGYSAEALGNMAGRAAHSAYNFGSSFFNSFMGGK